MQYEIDIFHYLNIYKKEWKKMAKLAMAAMLITAVMTSLQPPIYKSTLIALSPKEGGNIGGLGSYLGLPNLFSGASSDEIIFSMLKSRRTSRDINERFRPVTKGKFWWSLDTYIVTGGFAVEVKGPNPDLTMNIANFAVENLDKINMELQVTSQKKMVKVLDPAIRGVSAGRNVLKKALASGLMVFLAYSIFIFFREYFSHMRSVRNTKER